MKKIIVCFILTFIVLNKCYAQTVVEEHKFTLKTQNGTLKIYAKDILDEEEQVPFSESRSDTLNVPLYLTIDNIELILQSDIDSLKLSLFKDETAIIDIVKDGMQPFVLILKNGINYDNIEFNKSDKNPDFTIKYENNTANPYLLQLRAEYPIDSIISLAGSDLEKVRKVASWVHNLWKHDGMNEPEQSNALYILGEVKKGKRFRCVEYGIVTTACLNSIGIKSRTLSLKTKDAEIRPTGAGHVLLEVFLNDMDKWVMVDPQWDIIPHKENMPLNAVEFQSAINNREKIGIWTSEQIQAEEYIPWIYPYLYYFSIKFDNRENIDKNEQYTYQGKSSLMLVPLGAKEPTVFQQKFPIDYCFYTNSLKDFYSRPIDN